MKLKIVKGDKFEEMTKAVKEQGQQCPCKPVYARTKDTRCVCKEFREQDIEGHCHCYRYKKVRVD